MESWKTGFPIVDAGIRELNATGFMHNRVRMITASFPHQTFAYHWRIGRSLFCGKINGLRFKCE